MDWITVMGYIAGACTTTAFFPQAIKIVKTKHTKDLSLGMYAILTIGVLLWTVYGLVNQDWPLVIANTVTLVLSGWIFFLKLQYG